MNKINPSFIPSWLQGWLWLALLSGSAVRAEDESPDFEFREGPGWQEAQVNLPAFPQPADLLAVPLQLNQFPFTLLIDTQSLRLGDDRVTRYVAVLESTSGARNVLFEGIRCATAEVRTYAVGMDGRFDASAPGQWREIKPHGMDQFRKILQQQYFCDGSLRARDVKDVIGVLRQGAAEIKEY